MKCRLPIVTLFILAGCYGDTVCPQKMMPSITVHEVSGLCLSWHSLGDKPLFENKYTEAMRVCHEEANGYLHSFGTQKSGGKYFHKLPKEMYNDVQSKTNELILNGLRIVKVIKRGDTTVQLLFRHTSNTDELVTYINEKDKMADGKYGLTEETLTKLFGETYLEFPLCLTVKIGNKEFGEATYQPCSNLTFNMFVCEAEPLQQCTIRDNKCNCKSGYSGKFCQLTVYSPIDEFKEKEPLRLAIILITILLIALILLCVAYQKKLKRDRLQQRKKIKKYIEERRMLKRFDLVGSMASRIMSKKK